MKPVKHSAGILYKTFKYLFCFSLAFLAISFIVSFFFLPVPNLLPDFIISYKTTNAFVFFIFSIPVLQVGALFFIFSLLFSKMDDENMLERKEAMLLYLKNMMAILTVILVCNFLVFEGAAPLLKRKLKNYITQTEIYTDCINEAENLKYTRELHLNKMAINAAKHALDIEPNSEKARSLLEELTLAQAELLNVQPPEEFIPALPTQNLSVRALLNLASEAMQRLDFFSAHYFASQAVKLSLPESDEYKTAQNFVWRSWASIQNGDDTLRNENRALYEKKRAAYAAFQQEDYLGALDLFFEIKTFLKSTDPNSTDVQVDYFLRETKEKLKAHVFYYSDLEKSAAFKRLDNFSFQIKNETHVLYEIKAGGFAYRFAKQNAPKKNDDIFLKDVTVTKFNYLNQIGWTMHAEYIRVIPNPENKNEVRLQLTCMSADRTMQDIFPEVITGVVSKRDLLSCNIPIQLQTFMLVPETQNEAGDLDLLSLYRFTKSAPRLNLTGGIFLRELMFRILLPFLLFTVTIALASLAWNLRFNGTAFSFQAALFVPAIFLFAAIILEISLFIFNVLIRFFCAKCHPLLAVVSAAITWIVCTVYYAVKFYRQAKN